MTVKYAVVVTVTVIRQIDNGERGTTMHEVNRELQVSPAVEREIADGWQQEVLTEAARTFALSPPI